MNTLRTSKSMFSLIPRPPLSFFWGGGGGGGGEEEERKGPGTHCMRKNLRESDIIVYPSV